MTEGEPKVSVDRIMRSASFLKNSDAEQYPVAPLVTFLICIMVTDGMDVTLFPNVGKALERTVPQFNVRVIGDMATIQGFIQALCGPFWGVLCARGYMQRKTILSTMVFAQGLATLIMWFFMEQYWAMMFLRGINGACLAGLLPVANSIVADRFDDAIRGRMFALMNMSRGLGSTLFGMLYLATSEWCPADSRWGSCALPPEGCKVVTPPCACSGLFGWEFSFIFTGLGIMAFGPVVYIFMNPPPVNIRIVAQAGQNVIVSELKALATLLWNTPTFLILVVQGCFGGMPWSALSFRAFFFETAGLTKVQVTNIMGAIGFVGIAGGGISGWLSDTLVGIWPMHGRILNAEFSVYGGIPFAFFTFSQSMHPENKDTLYIYLFALQVLMHLICGGVGGGTNAPILAQLAEPEERALVIAWQASLEGSIANLGPAIFVFLNELFGYDAKCNDPCTAPDTCGTVDDNIAAAGNALVFTSSVPWVICGALYTSLHWVYPKDMERIFLKRQLENENAQATELVTS